MKKRKALLVVNPCSGKNKSRLRPEEVVEKMNDTDIDFIVKETTGPGDATQIVKDHADDCDLVICCGGDGTFNETINGVMSLEKRVPLGYIPMGSTNDLASTMCLPAGVDKATDIIKDGHTNGYDIGLFNNRYFSYVASFGPGSDLSYNTSQKLKNQFGHNAYVIYAVFFQLFHMLSQVKPKHIVFEYDGGVIEDDFFFCAISNSTSVGGVFKYDRNDVKLDDGLFEVLLVRKLRNPLEAIGMFRKIQKRDYDGDTLLYFKTSRARLTFSEPEAWTLDGEYAGEVKDIRFSVLSKAIDIYSPESSMFIGGEPQPVFVREPKGKKKKKAENEETVTETESTEQEKEPETVS